MESAGKSAAGVKQLATLGGGCFWCLEAVYEGLRGVESVQSGYMGGTKANPAYEEVCRGHTGHAEVVQVVFDPALVSFNEILEVFFVIHDPTTKDRQGNDVGTQYRSAIFTHSPEQIAAALASRDAYQRELSQAGFGDITTEIREAPGLYLAEEGHQQYLSKVPNGYCPNHSTGVLLPDVTVSPLRYVD